MVWTMQPNTLDGDKTFLLFLFCMFDSVNEPLIISLALIKQPWFKRCRKLQAMHILHQRSKNFYCVIDLTNLITNVTNKFTRMCNWIIKAKASFKSNPSNLKLLFAFQRHTNTHRRRNFQLTSFFFCNLSSSKSFIFMASEIVGNCASCFSISRNQSLKRFKSTI